MSNRHVYPFLTSQFFASKPVERLLGASISAQDLTDYTLGHALDDIAAYGASRLFGTVAFGINHKPLFPLFPVADTRWPDKTQVITP